MRLAIVGSQNFSEPWKYGVAENLIRSFLGFQETEIEVLISGGCPSGVDRMVETVGHWYGFTEENGDLIIHRPKNQRWAPEGFQERNMKIAMDCTHLVSIRCSESTTYGSGWTADQAEALLKQVWRFTL